MFSGNVSIVNTKQSSSQCYLSMSSPSTLNLRVTTVHIATSFVGLEMLWGLMSQDNTQIIHLKGIIPRFKINVTDVFFASFYFKSLKLTILLAAVEEKMVKDITENGVVWRCADCGHQTKFRTSLFEHVESKHVESSGYICQYCLKHCRTRNALRSHINRQHTSSNKWL